MKAEETTAFFLKMFETQAGVMIRFTREFGGVLY